jgi:hypothetical protein
MDCCRTHTCYLLREKYIGYSSFLVCIWTHLKMYCLCYKCISNYSAQVFQNYWLNMWNCASFELLNSSWHKETFNALYSLLTWTRAKHSEWILIKHMNYFGSLDILITELFFLT